MCFCGCVADAAGARAEGVPGSECVLLAILHPHIQEQAAESLRLARYGPAKMGGLGWRRGVWLEPVSQKTPHPPLLAPPLDLAGKCEGLRLESAGTV